MEIVKVFSRRAFSISLTVPYFNILKYFFMTYIVGFLWDIAYNAIRERRRYQDRQDFEPFGARTNFTTRNHLFETLWIQWKGVCKPQERHMNSKTSNNSNVPEMNKQFSKNDDASDGSVLGKISGGKTGSEPAQETLHLQKSKERTRRSLLKQKSRSVGLCIIVLIVILFEASSELFTDTEQRTSYKYEARRTLDQLRSSAAATHMFYYSPEISQLHLLRCSRPGVAAGSTVIWKANIIVESGTFDPSHNSYPEINKSVLCKHDKTKSIAEQTLIHTPIAPQKTSFEGKETFEVGDILHRVNDVKFVRELQTPLFFTGKPPQNRFEPSFLKTINGPSLLRFSEDLVRLVHLRIDGSDFTCTTKHPWCIREIGNVYEILYPNDPDYSKFGQFINANMSSNSFKSVWPINVTQSSFKRMKEDPYMQRPPFDHEIARLPYPTRKKQAMIEENLLMAAYGYNFGWISGSIVNGFVIVSEFTMTVPVVNIGFIISISVIVLISTTFLVYNAVNKRMRDFSDAN